MITGFTECYEEIHHQHQQGPPRNVTFHTVGTLYMVIITQLDLAVMEPNLLSFGFTQMEHLYSGLASTLWQPGLSEFGNINTNENTRLPSGWDAYSSRVLARCCCQINIHCVAGCASVSLSLSQSEKFTVLISHILAHYGFLDALWQEKYDSYFEQGPLMTMPVTNSHSLPPHWRIRGLCNGGK